ncbi:MAG: helix-turn-helix domain-containing protein [Candidatus Falkowbacteria bacterium]
MRLDKDKALRLRQKGFSYAQISAKLGVAKSTLSTWLKDVPISKEASEKIASRVHSTSIAALIKRNKNQTVLAASRYNKIKKEAKISFYQKMNSSNRDLFVAGVSLYWAEGYKRGAIDAKWKAFDFANTDASMLAIMVNFLALVCGVGNTKLSIQLIIHSDNDVVKAVRYWSNKLGVKTTQFSKAMIQPAKESKHKHQYGTIHLRIYSVELFYTMIGWIEELEVYFK